MNSFALVRKFDAKVRFELGYQLRNDGRAEGFEITESDEDAEVLIRDKCHLGSETLRLGWTHPIACVYGISVGVYGHSSSFGSH